ncbi:MAG: hypothetical protein HY761_02165 [Candidatus Omnitrophica bacterium]|nr:hypothetical protein [Candidatus Omnitrophota bacterium]
MTLEIIRKGLTFLFFGISLQSFYFYNVGLPVVSIISLFLMFGLLLFFKDGFTLRNDISIKIAFAYAFILFWSVLGFIFFGNDLDFKRFTSFFIIIFGALVAAKLLRKTNLESLVRFYLIAHVFFFFLQFIPFYVTGYRVDYLKPITGEEQRVIGGMFTFLNMERFMRAAGLFNEPGTYANFLAPFIALFGRWYKNSKFNTSLFWIALSTLFLSFSVSGIIFGIFVFLFSIGLNLIYRIVGAIVGVYIVAPYLYYRFIFCSSHGLEAETGLGIRQYFFEKLFGFIFHDPLAFLFGLNLLELNPLLNFPDMAAVNDQGLVFFFLFFAGPMLMLIFGIIILHAFRKLDWSSCLALTIVLFSKLSMFAPFFPFFLVAIFWNNEFTAPKKKLTKHIKSLADSSKVAVI